MKHQPMICRSQELDIVLIIHDHKACHIVYQRLTALVEHLTHNLEIKLSDKHITGMPCIMFAASHVSTQDIV